MNKIIPFILLFTLLFSCKEEVKHNAKHTTKKSVLVKISTPKNNTKILNNQNIIVNAVLDITRVNSYDLKINDSIISTGTKAEATLNLTINTSDLRFGEHKLTLVAHLKDNTIKTDNRHILILPSENPEVYTIKMKKAYPHLRSSYTQGLEFYNGKLYEGTGQNGQSLLAEVNLATGKQIRNKKLEAHYFGEGITILNDKVYQLTWKARKCFVYDLNTFEKINEFAYEGEGWGLTNNGSELIMSNGTNEITFRDPESFAVNRTIAVYTGNGPTNALNELEYIEGKIYANIYTIDEIVIIEPSNGKVDAVINAGIFALDYRNGGEYFNGIAYNKGKFYVTGKLWPELFEVEILKP